MRPGVGVGVIRCRSHKDLALRVIEEAASALGALLIAGQ
jgi:hypothetical protein